MNSFKDTKKDMNFLIKQTSKAIKTDSPIELKGLAIIAAVSTSNAIYERTVKDVLKRHLDYLLTKDTEKGIITYFQYKEGKELSHMFFSELVQELNTKSNLKMKTMNFISDHQSFKNIVDLHCLLLNKIPQNKLQHLMNICKFKNIMLETLLTRSVEDYKMRTQIIHGDYRKLSAVYHLWGGKVLDSLYLIYFFIFLIHYSVKTITISEP